MPRMWRVRAVLLLVLFATAAAAAPGIPSAPGQDAAARREADREGWPATRAGELARRWVRAFSTGEKAMKECLADILAPESLARKGVAVRVERYRDLRERFGTLTLVSVDGAEAGRLEVTLAASDLSQHRFTFNVQTAAPYKLLSVAMREPGHMLPGFGH